MTYHWYDPLKVWNAYFRACITYFVFKSVPYTKTNVHYYLQQWREGREARATLAPKAPHLPLAMAKKSIKNSGDLFIYLFQKSVKGDTKRLGLQKDIYQNIQKYEHKTSYIQRLQQSTQHYNTQ